jgi:hypothetical protein
LDDVKIDKVLELLESGGVVLFRGFKVDKDKWVEYSKRYSGAAIRHSAPSVRPNASDDGTVTEVLVGNHEIELHGEMYYLPRRPEFLWLYCVVPPHIGGATTVGSGADFLNALQPSTRNFFSQHKVKYHSRYVREGWIAFAPSGQAAEAIANLSKYKDVKNLVHEKSNDVISFDFITSAITKSKFGKDVFVNSILNIRQYANLGINKVCLEDGSEFPPAILADVKAASEKIVKPVNWQTNDFIVVENSSVMHGRQSFSGERKILTRFTMAA